MTTDERQIKEAFDKMDTDKSGFLEPDELKQALASLGQLTEEEVNAIAKAMLEEDDGNGDGKISYEEFKKGVEKENEKMAKK